MELNSEQIAYLKSLYSKKKKRKFLLNCLIENVEIIESKKIERCEVCQMFPKIEGANKCESCYSFVKHIVETSPEFAKYKPKSNYSPEEIELVKHNINQREVSEQGSELLKFEKLEEKEYEATINFIRRTYPKDTCLINIADKWESIINKS